MEELTLVGQPEVPLLLLAMIMKLLLMNMIENNYNEMGDCKGNYCIVSDSSVELFTLAMAAATGFCSIRWNGCWCDIGSKLISSLGFAFEVEVVNMEDGWGDVVVVRPFLAASGDGWSLKLSLEFSWKMMAMMAVLKPRGKGIDHLHEGQFFASL
ncbi:putative metal ion transporter [Corchorus olitorius]|uniref:Metal ion transporter n=1 Tax=Corchorus olitorius TaxID=93759 RepID=A0A1R3KFI1_9ROSI|nr:putative metal ion transporter [Corchorus olitorius]